MRGTIRFEFQVPEMEINVSKPARDVIGTENLPDFVELLRRFMRVMAFTWAYVGKEGKAIRISLGR